MSEELHYSISQTLMESIYLCLLDANERLNREGTNNIKNCLWQLDNRFDGFNWLKMRIKGENNG